MFAVYLDIQKRLDIEDLDELETKGRWKSFVNKWNRGDLAEGWYDPETLYKASKAASEQPPLADRLNPGPSIPTTSDLRAHHEQSAEDAALAHSEVRQTLQASRKADRTLQTARLDDLTPRAPAGSRERALENRALTNTANRTFAASAHDNSQIDIPDADVMGDEDSLGELKKMKVQQERKKNEREVRREEMLRARRAEREVKLKGMREREDKTMGMLREIARQRFGGGEDDG